MMEQATKIWIDAELKTLWTKQHEASQRAKDTCTYNLYGDRMECITKILEFLSTNG